MTHRSPASLLRESFVAAACATVVTVALAAVALPAHAQAQSASTVGKLPLDAQVAWLQRAAKQGDLEKLDDTQLIALFSSLDPLALPRYIEAGPNGYPSYEFTMHRSERIHGQWPSKPDHMLVRLAHDPLRIYAKWLPDGNHAGEEVLYDASTRSDELYGHFGGILRAVSIWTSIHGLVARAQSRHPVTDLGTEYIARRFLFENEHFTKTNGAQIPKIGVETDDGVRVVTFTYTTPAEPASFDATKQTLGLDLRHPWFRVARLYGADGRIIEDLVFEHIEPKTFDANTFDAKNPAYRF